MAFRDWVFYLPYLSCPYIALFAIEHNPGLRLGFSMLVKQPHIKQIRLAGFHAAIDFDVLINAAAARQNFAGCDECQWKFIIGNLAVKNFNPARAAITAAALVFDLVSGTLQALQQGFPLLKLKRFVMCADECHGYFLSMKGRLKGIQKSLILFCSFSDDLF